MKYFLDPFGCVKNQVDAETMMAFLNGSGWEAASGVEEAEVIIINSCGFIEKAKQESINAVLAWRKLCPAKKIVLAGCLVQRYAKDLSEALPEADILFGNKDLSLIPEAAAAALTGIRQAIIPPPPQQPGKHPPAVPHTSPAPLSSPITYQTRPLLSLPGSAYVKISEGCNNRCTFCSIPLIRGNLQSRSIEEIVAECQALLDRGVRELCLIGQDIGSYGMDLPADFPSVLHSNTPSAAIPAGTQQLPALLKAISGLSGDFWVRLLYIHPDRFPLPILDIIAEDRRFLPYFDIPFQHGSDRILKLMNRKKTSVDYLSLIGCIRARIADAVIRSTFLLGFPSETDDDVRELLDFQEKARLDWLGCFAYSREEDTPAYAMKSLVPKKVAERRKTLVEEHQAAITEKQMDRFVGRVFDVLVEERVEGEDLWLGRLFCQAPEVDGAVVINSDAVLTPGAFARCKIFARAGFDLEAVVLQG